MKNLLPGLRKFSETVFPKRQALFESLQSSQKPHTLLITCSDSRIDPNLVTQTEPGELFVLRNAGNIIPPFGSSSGGEAAAIEFAIDGLGVANIVVCGHSQCGAMRALQNSDDLAGMPSLRAWLLHAEATKKRVKKLDESGRASLRDLIQENVLVQISHLKTHPAVSAALRAGKVHIFGWVYEFETGNVLVYDTEKDAFVPSHEISIEADKNVNRFAL